MRRIAGRTLIALSLVGGALFGHPGQARAGTPADPTVRLDPTSVSVGLTGTRTVRVNAPVTAAGVVRAPGGGLLTQVGGLVGSLLEAVLQPLAGVRAAPVSLEYQTPTGWSTLRRVNSAPDGRFSMAVPTYAYGAFTWRVTTSATATSAAASSAPFKVAVKTPFTPRGSGRSFRLLSSSAPRWNPCTPVPYYVNPSGMPRGAMGTVRSALAQLQAATGLTFRYAGSSRGVPFRAGNTTAGMPRYGFTIAWSTPTTVRRLKGATVGLSGAWSQSSQTTSGQRYVAGGLVIDRTERLRTGFARGRSLGYVLIHELGHMVGLGHTSDRSQVMSTSMTSRSIARYGAGDLAGLAAVGMRGGCL